MKIKVLSFLLFITSNFAFSQKTDTLTFYSHVFNETRSVYVHIHGFYKYQSDSVKLPVIYILDGQREWFVNPLLSTIKYLQYTHEIPNAIVVVIPYKNRNKEYGIKNVNEIQPLDKFITQEVDSIIKAYKPGDYKVIIGHSFSASFALYTYINHPDYYSAVISHTPLDQLEALLIKADGNTRVNKAGIFISVGGAEKDEVHRKEYNRLKSKFHLFFDSINTFEAENSKHNAVPIVATPSFLTKMFLDFSDRHSEIAKVDTEYKLISKPSTIDNELAKIQSASKIGNSFYPPEVAEINGIASRFSYNGHISYALKLYEMGTFYYPGYYRFYLSIYKLLLKDDLTGSKKYLEKAKFLLETMEDNSLEKQEILQEIATEMKKNKW
jgi:predicted alpha/beta superfamily hydrolase